MLLRNKIIDWTRLDELKKKQMLLRPQIAKTEKFKLLIQSILSNVKKFGDIALQKYTREFDNFELSCFKVSQKKINNSESFLTSSLKQSILVAKKNITYFHKQQKIPSIDIETQIGMRCQQIIFPIESVGLYVPGGTAPLLSTALMLAIPASIAGCKNLVLCSPPPIMNEILYVAKICKISNVFEVGGAQAIAALGFGTETIPAVDKIFGPGNIYVTEAKNQIHQLLSHVSIDMIAGPSELLIITDMDSNPIFIAADVLSQCEHGPDSQVIVISDTKKILEKVIFNIHQQMNTLSRQKIILKSLENCRFILSNSLLESIMISNLYAPEHLIIQTKSPRQVLHSITNAGSVFLGYWTPESIGDYASGTNHVLPTNRNVVSCSGLSVYDFQKKITVQELTPLGLKNIAYEVEILSKSEHLDAHANAVTVRLEHLRN